VEVKTSQLNCAAYLSARGHKLLRVEAAGNGHRFCRFVFECGPETQRDMDSYFEFRANIDARTYAHALAKIKRMAREKLEEETRNARNWASP
jgi:hypothetical protein